MKKKLLALSMLIVMVISIIPFSASAATNESVWAPESGWSPVVTCTLKNSKKDGYVKVGTNAWGQRVDIQMLDSANRVIWSENNTLNTSCKSAYITREYKLGKNRSVYKLRFRVKGCGNTIKVTKDYWRTAVSKSNTK